MRASRLEFEDEKETNQISASSLNMLVSRLL